MAVFRGTVVFCCLGTFFVITLLFISASAEDEEYSLDFPEIHTVSHTIDHGCKGGVDPEKGDQCQENGDDDEDLDEDVDDTYKIVNKVKVSLSSAGKLTPPETLDDDDDSSESNEDHYYNDRVVVLGH